MGRVRASARPAASGSRSTSWCAQAPPTGSSAASTTERSVEELDLVLEERVPVGEGDGLRPVVDAELLEDPLRMGADRLRADDEPVCDRALAQSFREERDHLELAVREPAGAVLGPLVMPLEEPARS